MIKGSILQEDTTILNVYSPYNSVKLCEAKTENCKLTSLSSLETSTLLCQEWTEQPSRQEIKKIRE